MESGPSLPKTELQKIGEALKSALDKKYSDLRDEVSTGLTVNGNPQIVQITFKISTRHPSHDTAHILNHFHEDVQELLEEYEMDMSAYDIELSSAGETEHTLLLKSRI
jgi:hypothetical protein